MTMPTINNYDIAAAAVKRKTVLGYTYMHHRLAIFLCSFTT